MKKSWILTLASAFLFFGGMLLVQAQEECPAGSTCFNFGFLDSAPTGKFISPKVIVLTGLTIVGSEETEDPLSHWKVVPRVDGFDRRTLVISGDVAAGAKLAGVATGSLVAGGSGNVADVEDAYALIIGGESNVAKAAYSLILGGLANQILSLSTGAVIGGGDRNVIDSTPIGMIGGGQQNALVGGSTNFILGMKNNLIMGGERNFIAGTNTSISGDLDGVFAWSDHSGFNFKPQESGVFYANVQRGIGVNTTTPQAKLDSYGAVRIAGDIVACTAENAGLITPVVRGDGVTCICGCYGDDSHGGLTGWQNLTFGYERNKCESICLEQF